jgi:glycosyltransferase involved in cell wall biosynthesis
MLRKLTNKIFGINGLSVLISAQNDRATILQCVASFLEFADEIVVCINNSVDGTPELLRETYRNHDKVNIIIDNSVLDLSGNRRRGLRECKYRWVLRADADYICFDSSGIYESLARLKSELLSIFPIWPTAIFVEQYNLYEKELRVIKSNRNTRAFSERLPRTFDNGFMDRVYSKLGLRFINSGSNETIRYKRFYRKKFRGVYWVHLTISSPEKLFYRAARRGFRESGRDWSLFDSYVHTEFVKNHFPELSFEEAVALVWEGYIKALGRPISEDYPEFKIPKQLR